MNALPSTLAPIVEIWQGDALRCLELLPSDTFDCVVTSPPYWGLRDYGVEGQIGLEPTMAAYLATMIGVCRELRRVLKPSGTFWLNIGDSYSGSWGAQGRRITESDDPSWHGSQIKNHPRFASGTGSSKRSGLKQKDLCMIPNRLAIALQDDGWWVRSEIIWAKPNPMPESVTDRPTSSHEKIWLLAKSERYYFDAAAIAEPSVADHGSGNGFKRDARLSYADASGARGSEEQWTGVSGTRNARNVWTISTKPFKGAHFATFPPDLAERCIKAGCPPSGRVLDPFGGAGTTGLVAQRLGRSALLIELNEGYCEMVRRRIEAAR
jgi:DNA modification methylase